MQITPPTDISVCLSQALRSWNKRQVSLQRPIVADGSQLLHWIEAHCVSEGWLFREISRSEALVFLLSGESEPPALSGDNSPTPSAPDEIDF